MARQLRVQRRTADGSQLQPKDQQTHGHAQEARIVEIVEGSRPVDEVRIGSLVTFVRWGENGPGAEETWEIGGHGDSQPTQVVVAYDAPLGAALCGLRVGEYAEDVRLGESYIDLEVLALHPARESLAA